MVLVICTVSLGFQLQKTSKSIETYMQLYQYDCNSLRDYCKKAEAELCMNK